MLSDLLIIADTIDCVDSANDIDDFTVFFIALVAEGVFVAVSGLNLGRLAFLANISPHQGILRLSSHENGIETLAFNHVSCTMSCISNNS